MGELTLSGDCKPTVELTGAAKEWTSRSVDPVSIWTCDGAYRARVRLPCNSRDIDKLKCLFNPKGKVHIEVATRSDEISPPGLYTITFNLPGDVETKHCRTAVTADGIFDFIILRHGLPEALRARFIKILKSG
ncbi:HSP20-like chaperones superfamily protein [Forsythia ovata]|uniref:HSP20-like chaperones superfamily protein n=1 Tax=Forsythia ovata TaxID=205694 RepID=A0ABD1RQV5_9LAMI